MKNIAVAVVVKAEGFQVDIRVRDGIDAIFAKGSVEEKGLFIGKIVAIFTELARKKGILSNDETFGFELADSAAGIWNFVKGKEETFEGIFDELEIEDVFLVPEEDAQQESEIITIVEIPDDDATANEWQEFIENLGGVIFG